MNNIEKEIKNFMTIEEMKERIRHIVNRDIDEDKLENEEIKTLVRLFSTLYHVDLLMIKKIVDEMYTEDVVSAMRRRGFTAKECEDTKNQLLNTPMPVYKYVSDSDI